MQTVQTRVEVIAKHFLVRTFLGETIVQHPEDAHHEPGAVLAVAAVDIHHALAQDHCPHGVRYGLICWKGSSLYCGAQDRLGTLPIKPGGLDRIDDNPQAKLSRFLVRAFGFIVQLYDARDAFLLLQPFPALGTRLAAA